MYTLILIIHFLVAFTNALALDRQPSPTIVPNPHPSLKPSDARPAKSHVSDTSRNHSLIRLQNQTWSQHKRSPTPSEDALEGAATPAPTAPGSSLTTVHITSEKDFALLLPSKDGGTFASQRLEPCTIS